MSAILEDLTAVVRAIDRGDVAWDTCAACGLFRPVYPEPDATEVCADCFHERNPMEVMP